MMLEKASTVLLCILFLLSSSVCQNPAANRDIQRYPNELKGFELMRASKLKTLVPGVSTEKDVLKIFGDEKDCRNRHERLGVCELDENWYVSFTYDGETNSGILWSIEFYPRRRTPFSKVKFANRFEKGGAVIVHLPIEVENLITFSDKFGLSYVIVAEKGDDEFRKGDLFYIEYGLPEK